MKLSEAWLREWVNPEVTREVLVEQLTAAGLEVDAVEAVAGQFSGVVVGHITAVKPHPEADKLQLCTVDYGADEPMELVCGGKNARQGLKVAMATLGAKLPGLEIKPTKIRGVLSQGMLCSAKELGIEDDTDGILELPEDAPVGTTIETYLQLDDVTIDIGLTPNRGDCLSVLGVAREVRAFCQTPLTPPQAKTIDAATETRRSVHIDAPEDCCRYIGRVVQDVNLDGVTPLWMKEKLRRSGLRSISPVVDITNYVMLELGQPMHAFDLAQLSGDICVRRAREDEQLTLLDGQELILDNRYLVIADDEKPLALGGVMGGELSGVNDRTQDIFLESAYFNPVTIASRPQRQTLQSDSAHRFERGVDPKIQRCAMERATQLVLEILGGRPGPITESATDSLPQQQVIPLRQTRIESVLGMSVPTEQVADGLTRLSMKVQAIDGGWQVLAPSYRHDIMIEEDLIEEVARILGYDNIPYQPLRLASEDCQIAESTVCLRAMRNRLVERDYQEVVTYSFVAPELQKLLQPEVEAKALANPISQELAVMRTDLWAGLLQVLKHNQHRQQSRVRIFETGLQFHVQDGELRQTPMLAGLISGDACNEQWGQPSRGLDFYDLKADVESIFALLRGAGPLTFVAGKDSALHPGQMAKIVYNGIHVGRLGALHPRLQQQLGLNHPVYVFDLQLEEITTAAVPKFVSLSKYPSIRRDMALLVKQSVTVASLLDTVKKVASEWLHDVLVFDVYEGQGIAEGMKSVALGLVLQHPERTLVEDEAASVVQQIAEALSQQYAATLRE